VEPVAAALEFGQFLPLGKPLETKNVIHCFKNKPDPRSQHGTLNKIKFLFTIKYYLLYKEERRNKNYRSYSWIHASK
jgi:hypothetical protein